MIVLAIWLGLIGYTVAWTGARNMGLSYQPQSDGSIKMVDGAGKPAQATTLMDAITCGGGRVAPPPQGSGSGAGMGGGPARHLDILARGVYWAGQDVRRLAARPA